VAAQPPELRRPAHRHVVGTLFLADDGALGNNSQAASQMGKVITYIDSAFLLGREVLRPHDLQHDRGKGYGPLAADRTASTPGLEYHAWPAAATASWELLGGSTVNRAPF
jgi:hypothetical protein